MLENGFEKVVAGVYQVWIYINHTKLQCHQIYKRICFILDVQRSCWQGGWLNPPWCTRLKCHRFCEFIDKFGKRWKLMNLDVFSKYAIDWRWPLANRFTFQYRLSFKTTITPTKVSKCENMHKKMLSFPTTYEWFW